MGAADKADDDDDAAVEAAAAAEAATADGVVALRNTPCEADRGKTEARPAVPLMEFAAAEPGREEEGGDE